MGALKTGTYVPRSQVKVTVWPKPDIHGDGDDVYEDRYSANNEYLGREAVTTDDGTPIRHYLPPEGFANHPSRDPGADGNPDNYVRVNERGVPVRNRMGQAVGIRPGTALLEYPDGTHGLLTDDFSQKVFADSHEEA